MARKFTVQNKPPLGQTILTALEAKRKTQKWLALEIQISPQHICNVISGHDIPSLSLIFTIAKNLEIEPAVLFASVTETRHIL